ncbi:MAG: serine/threonine protein kinase, partial [Polyangiaceae bacterium]|nr:serine/threonine protein kinase [Polyangiaceae bacterium]
MATRGTSIGPAGKYRYLLDLGSGGMAKVWLALRSGPAGFRKLMVVKELREHFAEQPAFRNMFLEEARLAARLQHPNIVQTVEVGEDDGRYFLVMEYLDGQSLQAVIERKPLPVPMALSVLCDALSGLHAAHEWKDFDETVLSVVHRDVSPHNILLTYDGQVKVVDFGIAKTVHSGSNLTQQGTFRGKVGYVAPEQAAGETVDRRADVFAAGVVLFELLTRRRMWGDLPDVAILHRLNAGQIPSPRAVAPELPPALERICMRALSRDPAQRYATAIDFRAELERYLAGTRQRTGLAELGPHMKALFAEDRKRTRDLIQRRLTESVSPQRSPEPSSAPQAPPPLPAGLRASAKSVAPARKVPPIAAATSAPRASLPLPDTRPIPRPPVIPPPRAPSSTAAEL